MRAVRSCTFAACAAFLVTAGCKSRKHEPPVPGPQVTVASSSAACDPSATAVHAAIAAISGRTAA